MEASGEASNVLIAEALDPVTATMIAAILVVVIFVIPIASVLTSAFSKSLVIVLATGLLSTAGFLISIYPHHPVAVPVGIGIQVGGLLLAIGGVQSRRKLAAVWHAFEELSASAHAPSIVPHEEPSSHIIPAPMRESLTRY